MLNKRLERLKIAKRLIKVKPDASAEEIAGAVRNIERKRPRDPVRGIGEFLDGYKRK
jgi:hypothetical protein